MIRMILCLSRALESMGDMAKVFYVGVLAGLALCKYSEAGLNTTQGSVNRNESQCHHLGNRDNCTDTDTGQWSGHFSKCPEDLIYYCIHGECRYIKEQETASCRCQNGYVGSRCEYYDFLKQEKQRIIIICIVVGLGLLILLVLFICIFSHRRNGLCKQKRSRRDEPRNGTDKLHMDAGSTLLPDPTEHTTNAV